MNKRNEYKHVGSLIKKIIDNHEDSRSRWPTIITEDFATNKMNDHIGCNSSIDELYLKFHNLKFMTLFMFNYYMRKFVFQKC